MMGNDRCMYFYKGECLKLLNKEQNDQKKCENHPAAYEDNPDKDCKYYKPTSFGGYRGQ